MNEQTIEAMVKGLIEAQVIQALNSAPEAIEKLVKSALSKPVCDNGRPDGYGSKMPYLDYLVGEEIRMATRVAVQKVITEYAGVIEAKVREGLSSETVVAAFTNAIVGATKDEWRINVKFEAERER